MNSIFMTIWVVSLPLRHLSLTSSFGYRVHPITGKYDFHSGVDLKAHQDTVYAVFDGVVKSCGNDRLLGIHILLAHSSLESVYGHLSQIFVLPGDTVACGDPIAITGATGKVTGEHLHFSIKYHHRAIDPLHFLLAITNYLQNKNKENNK